MRFQTAEGDTFESQNGIGSSSPPRVGDEVTVVYDPTRPEDARVALASTFRINFKPLAIIGAIFVGVMFPFFFLFVGTVVLVSLS